MNMHPLFDRLDRIQQRLDVQTSVVPAIGVPAPGRQGHKGPPPHSSEAPVFFCGTGVGLLGQKNIANPEPNSRSRDEEFERAMALAIQQAEAANLLDPDLLGNNISANSNPTVSPDETRWAGCGCLKTDHPADAQCANLLRSLPAGKNILDRKSNVSCDETPIWLPSRLHHEDVPAGLLESQNSSEPKSNSAFQDLVLGERLGDEFYDGTFNGERWVWDDEERCFGNCPDGWPLERWIAKDDASLAVKSAAEVAAPYDLISDVRRQGMAARSNGANYWESSYRDGSLLQVTWKAGWDWEDAALKEMARQALDPEYVPAEGGWPSPTLTPVPQPTEPYETNEEWVARMLRGITVPYEEILATATPETSRVLQLPPLRIEDGTKLIPEIAEEVAAAQRSDPPWFSEVVGSCMMCGSELTVGTGWTALKVNGGPVERFCRPCAPPQSNLAAKAEARRETLADCYYTGIGGFPIHRDGDDRAVGPVPVYRTPEEGEWLTETGRRGLMKRLASGPAEKPEMCGCGRYHPKEWPCYKPPSSSGHEKTLQMATVAGHTFEGVGSDGKCSCGRYREDLRPLTREWIGTHGHAHIGELTEHEYKQIEEMWAAEDRIWSHVAGVSSGR